MRNLYLTGLAVILIVIGIWLLFFTRVNNSDFNLQTLRGESKVIPSPFPFMELTIPYFQNRDYISKLSELQKIDENTSYNSYLTSYDSDGIKINGLLTQPNEQKPTNGWPAIVFVHGYIPPDEYQTLENYSSYVDYFAKNGFVVFKIDLRGHAESEGEASGAYYSGDYIIDVLNAKSALENSDFVRKGSVGLWGHSMAGNVIFRALASKSDIKAAVIWAGAVYTYEDWNLGINDNSYRPPDDDSERAKKRRELFSLYGEFDSGSEFWKQVPATNYLDNVKSAIQIHHALDDKVVNIEYSRNLTRILDKTSIVHELYEYESGGHNLSDESFNEAMRRSVEFYKRYLN